MKIFKWNFYGFFAGGFCCWNFQLIWVVFLTCAAHAALQTIIWMCFISAKWQIRYLNINGISIISTALHCRYTAFKHHTPNTNPFKANFVCKNAAHFEIMNIAFIRCSMCQIDFIFYLCSDFFSQRILLFQNVAATIYVILIIFCWIFSLCIFSPLSRLRELLEFQAFDYKLLLNSLIRSKMCLSKSAAFAWIFFSCRNFISFENHFLWKKADITPI